MDIAVLGAGNVGSALGRGWRRAGHRIVFGARDWKGAEVTQLVQSIGANARAVPAAELASFADIIVVATPWSATTGAICALGDLKDKILIDCTNPLAPDLRGLAIGPNDSAAEQIARAAPGAHVVKAFNTTGSNNMIDPVIGGERLTMFICGDDGAANQTAAALAEQIGFEAVVTGPLCHARFFEQMAMLWIDMALHQKFGRDFGFKLLRR